MAYLWPITLRSISENTIKLKNVGCIAHFAKVFFILLIPISGTLTLIGFGFLKMSDTHNLAYKSLHAISELPDDWKTHPRVHISDKEINLSFQINLDKRLDSGFNIDDLQLPEDFDTSKNFILIQPKNSNSLSLIGFSPIYGKVIPLAQGSWDNKNKLTTLHFNFSKKTFKTPNEILEKYPQSSKA